MKQPGIEMAQRRLPGRFAAGGIGALAVLTAGHFVVDAYSSAYAPLLAILRERLGLTYAQVGAGAALFAFSASFMQPLYGFLSDRINSSIIIVMAPAVAAIGMASVPLVGAYPATLACLFVAGIGIAAFHPQGASQAADTLSHRPSLAMALFIGGGNIGFSLGPALVTASYAFWGWDGLWRIGIPGIVAALLLAPTAPTPTQPTHHGRGSVGTALRKRWKPLLTMYVFVVVRGIVQLIFVTFLPLYLIDSGMSNIRVGAALSVFLAIGSIGSLAGGVFADRVGERAIIRLSMAGSLPLFLGAFMLESLTARLAVLSAAFFVLLLSNPLTIVLAQSWVPKHRSTVSALLMGFAWGLGGMLAPLFGGVADIYGLGPSLAAVGGLPLLGAMLAWALPGRDG